MKKIVLSLLVLGWSLVGVHSAKIKVASLSTITTDIARNVGGEQLEIAAIVQPGIDPHEFQLTPQDAMKIAESDLVFYTGKGMEGYLTKLKETGAKNRFIDTGKSIPSLKLEEDGKEIEDPHWWHSIANVKQATRTVRDALILADPADQSIYEKNAAAYLASLDALEAWVRQKVALLPRDMRKLVTSHDAFQYFARDYGFKIYAIEGVSTSDDPSSRKVVELMKTIRDQGVKAVFFENIENPKVVGEITKETGAKVGGELYADGLGEGDASTYAGMMKHNVNTIVDSLK